VLSYDSPIQGRAFAQNLTLPVRVSAGLPLAGALAASLTAPVPHFSFRMSEAIRAVERHVFVEGLPANPIALVEGFVAAFTWEFDNYWTVDIPQNAYYPQVAPGVFLTIEHVARAGELIAEGIALLFLERRLGVSRANCSFIAPSGNRPRLDYAFTPIHGTRLSVLCPGFPRLQLEVRSRKQMTSLTKRDRTRLLKKKKGHSAGQTLAIYCSYGAPSTGYGGAHLILADPPGDDRIVSEEEAVPTILANYERITSRLGLWQQNAILRREIRARRLGVTLPRASYDELNAPRLRLAVRETMDGKLYRGREFSDALTRAEQDPASAARLYQRASEMGDLGNVTFHGLNVEALELVEAGEWGRLARFIDRDDRVTGQQDRVGNEEQPGSQRAAVAPDAGPIITGDGVYRRTETASAETPEGAEILNVLRMRATRA
jgi:hypothetical protein